MLRRCLAIALLAAASGFVFAQEVPLTNWTVPPYRASGASGGLTTMTDVSPGVGFVAIQPCRVADTRGNGAPITGGIFANSEARNWLITGKCGIPSGTDAISANFSVVSPAATPTGAFLLAWPTGQPAPPTAIMTYGPGVTVISNAAVVPLNASGQMTVNVSHSTHVILDVNGYFTDQYNPGVSFHAVSSIVAPAILAENTSQVNDAIALHGVITSTNPGANAVAVRGTNNSTSDKGGGVLGVHNGSAFGVWGITVSGSGVFGEARATTGTGKGVFGVTSSLDPNTAGVFGVASGLVPGASYLPAGVRGESAQHIGVLGVIANGNLGRAVVGSIQGTGVSGVLGYDGGVGNLYGVRAFGNARVSNNLDVENNFSSANKWFVEPHPHDASKEIRYVSLEGPHAEVYFRGTAQISRGVTRIEIPQDFRFVADAGTYSTLVTPVGAMATVAVMSQGEEGIVVQASRDVKVAYVVYAERKAIKNPDPIAENEHFRPESDHDIFESRPESYRKLLMQNGTLNADGTLNLETARRLGWDKEWAKQTPPAPQPTTD